MRPVKLLLDTHAFLWAVEGAPELSNKAAGAYTDTGNELYLSAAAYWEICLKVSAGKLDLREDWTEVFDREMEANSIRWLPLEKEHLHEVIGLPWHHRDPFDRLLVAQARCEGMSILTADRRIAAYDVSTIW